MSFTSSNLIMCTECDGCGLTHNHVCGTCNGHGEVLELRDTWNNRVTNHKVFVMQPTKQQLKAMEMLGVTQ